MNEGKSIGDWVIFTGKINLGGAQSLTALSLLLHELLHCTRSSWTGGLCFPQCSSVSAASLSPSLSPSSPASPQWHQQLCGRVCWASLSLWPSIYWPSPPQQTGWHFRPQTQKILAATDVKRPEPPREVQATFHKYICIYIYNTDNVQWVKLLKNVKV